MMTIMSRADVGHLEGELGAALVEHAEEDRRQHDAGRMRAAHQRHGDADEAGAGDEVERDVVLVAHDRVQRHHAGERAGDQHGDDDDARLGDAGVARGLRAEAHGAHLVAELGAPDQHPDDEGHDEREQEGDVERREGRTVKPNSDRNQPSFGSCAPSAKLARLRRHRAGRLQHVDQQIDHGRRGDEVEHDGGDDDVGAALGLQPGGDERPERADGGRAEDRDREGQPPGQDWSKARQTTPTPRPAI